MLLRLRRLHTLCCPSVDMARHLEPARERLVCEMGRWQLRELRALETLSDDLNDDMICGVVFEPLRVQKARPGRL